VIEIESDDYIDYNAYIRKDFRYYVGDLVIATRACSSVEKVCDDLERMLAIRCEHA
jgi:hypothetical protein